MDMYIFSNSDGVGRIRPEKWIEHNLNKNGLHTSFPSQFLMIYKMFLGALKNHQKRDKNKEKMKEILVQPAFNPLP